MPDPTFPADGRLSLLHEALDHIATDATIVPEGCPEPWRSTLVDWARAAGWALDQVPVTPRETGRIAELERALRALVALEPHPHAADGWVSCRGCWVTVGRGVTPEAFPHRPDCPVAVGRALLVKEGEP